MRRFWCDSVCGSRIFFDKEESNHISRVLRLEKGEHITVCDGTGIEYDCEIVKTGEKCEAEVICGKMSESEIKGEIALFQAVIKNEKMDTVIQKATELGITKIVPVITEYSVVKIDDASKKRERWQKIAQTACKQCGRAKMPVVEEAMSFESALGLFGSYEQKIVAYEDERTRSICESVCRAESTAYFIGPEGGITKSEHEKLVSCGAKSVSLGKRILRAETASIVCGALIIALTGEMDV